MRRIVASALLIALSLAAGAEAAILNISGELEVSYSWSRDDQGGKVIKEVSDFEQRYSLRNSGDLWDPRIGTFMLNGTFLNQEIQTRGEPVDAQNLYNNLRLADYSGSVNLMQRMAPLTFTVQQITQFSGAGSCYFFCSSGLTQKDRSTNYNLNWIIPLDHLPTVRVNLNQLNQKSSAGLFSTAPTNITTRFANVEVSDRFNGINVMTRYQFSQTDFEGQGNASANAVNLNVDGQLTEALSLTASGDYTNQGGVNTSQVSFVQERGGSVALFYRPSPLWDGSLSYNMSESPGGIIDFKRQVAQVSLNVRPTSQVDIFGSYQYMTFSSGPSVTDSQFGTAGFNWRPAFGLLTGTSLTYGDTDASVAGTSGTTDTTVQNYRYFINYTKGLDRFRLTTGYSISYGTNKTDSAGGSVVSGKSTPGTTNTSTTLTDTNQSFAPNQFVNFLVTITGGLGAGQVRTITGNTANQLTVSPPWTTTPDATSTYRIYLATTTYRDLLNTANISFENIDVRLIHWLISYAFTDTRQSGDTVQPDDNQRSNVVQINADSSYFKNLLLQASASYTNIEGFGTQGRTIQLDTRATYLFWQGLSLSGEWNHQDFPGGYFGDSDTFTGEAQWVNTVWQRTTLLFDVKEIYQNNHSTNDRQTLQGQSQLMYQLGKLLLTVSYLYLRDEGIGTAPPLNSQNFFVRAIRSF